MESARFSRRTVALIAAYAVVLQALLSGLVPAVPLAVAPFGILCSHDANGGTGQPAEHELPCAAICAALGHGIAGPLPPTIHVVPGPAYAIATLAPASDWVAPRLAVRSPQYPRGPPLA
jgi:hypothetical protein